MDRVSVVTPTYHRPEPLRRALLSLFSQTDLGDLAVEVIVVDNSAEADAHAAVEALAEEAPFPVIYVSEPRPGVANARNAGVAAARGRWVAFLDDDEEAAPLWLAALVEVARNTGADAVFGPIEACAEGGGDIGAFAPFFERRIRRPEGADITDLAAFLGTNNSMFDRAACLSAPVNFDPRLNEVGGEDSLLLQQLVKCGRRFHFAPRALVREWAPQRRLTWAYVKKRKFVSGQIRVFVQNMIHPGHYGVIALWMAVGVAQTLVFGAAALAAAPFGAELSQKMAARVHGGLGKIFWAPRFRPALYGRGLVS
ncbi:glycosyltransferase [Rhodoblastus acidophilus]|uniref:Glycosyltransferase n=1 Tax=Candidatus Rhodoblastus alkanivorans TaxID=2954117 RepID=A0ABS9Z2V0_9HYPH|nr:glycosyltransferase family 2 protein [Candidatus Rhodoblastus alkanivorans]MCI4680449.1 glycosyltransferase [Candidatus Rhodoblastus alkanivorans]MCI4681942.1 glycosyltransferase [Candidatus Rhodoblastus alkanivorans]MDI4642992.1 glycosyltransferase [Rhodoblastus acidophilus]